MPFISPGHFWMILLLLIVVLIIWGPGKLPDVGAGMGRAIREFKKASNEVRDTVTNASSTEHSATPPIAPPPPAVAPPPPPPAATPPRSEVGEEPKAQV
ncbi:MAG TPA: twin-arginine translocase TatA/TatE family subunit [Candidatus Dormibacteraeota bacterium]